MNPDLAVALNLYREISILASMGSLLHWDMATMMPEERSGNRVEQQEALAVAIHRLETSTSYRNAVESLTPAHDRSPEEAAIRKLLQRELATSLALDETFVAAMERSGGETETAWKAAKKSFNFKDVAQFLQAQVELQREYADRLRSSPHLQEWYAGKSRYEVLLDQYDSGFSSKEARHLIAETARKTKEILPRLSERPAAESQSMNEQDQMALAWKFARGLGFHPGNFRIDTAPHPFSTAINGDTRITTRWDLENFLDGFSSVTHECGHALYDEGINPSYRHTPLQSLDSHMAPHESQSRFWEVMIGSSPPFLRWLSHISGHPEAALRTASLSVKPGMVRLEADPVTYNLHIHLRMKLEEELIEGTLSAHDLPNAWNEEIKAWFGLTVPHHGKGCLQDIHWFSGAYGYFPSYTIGNLFAAELFEKMKEEIPDWEKHVEIGSLGEIREFLRKTVHQFGALRNSRDTIAHALGRDLKTDAFFRFVNERFLLS